MKSGKKAAPITSWEELHRELDRALDEAMRKAQAGDREGEGVPARRPGDPERWLGAQRRKFGRGR